MFSDVLEKISWDETTQKIASKTDADVVRALAKERLDVDDFMALISPAAVPHLEEMARLSQKYTQERFGKTISMYIPLYLSTLALTSAYTAVSTTTTRSRALLSTTRRFSRNARRYESSARLKTCSS